MNNPTYDRYAELRDSLNLTDYKVSKLAQLKGTATISNWKNGKYIPKDDKMREIAKVLNTTTEYIMRGTEQDFIIDMPEEDAKLSIMDKELKKYAIKMSELKLDDQKFIMQMIDKLYIKKGE